MAYQYYFQDAMTRNGTRLNSYLSVQFLADLLGVSKAAVNIANRQLCEKGLIQRISRRQEDGHSKISVTQLQLVPELLATLESAATRTPSTRSADKEANQRADHSSCSNLPPEPADVLEEKDTTGNKQEIEEIRLWEKRHQEAREQLANAEKSNNLALRYKWFNELNLAEDKLKMLRQCEQADPPPPPSPTPAQRSRTNTAGLSVVTEKIPRNLINRSGQPRPLNKDKLETIQRRIMSLPGLSNPKQVLSELLFQVTVGVYQDMPLNKALNICLKTIRQNRWRTPTGYIIGATPVV
jgi:biotin operon repressor